MPLSTTPHSITSPITDFGAVGETKDAGGTHATDTPNVLGAMINKHSADIKQLHDREYQRSTVVPHTSTYGFVDADHGKIHTTAGATGAASTREWTLPIPIAGNHRFPCYDSAGVGIRLRARTGHKIRFGTLESADAGYIETLDIAKSYLEIIAISSTLWLVLPSAEPHSIV